MAGLVAIHQPNFFPWLGYFDKIRRADVFVLLDAVDYPRIAMQGEARWVTCPLRRMPLGSPILAAEIDDSQPWRAKLLRTLETNYRKAPSYLQSMVLLEPLINSPETNLAAFNIAAITAIAAYLGLSSRFVRQSSLRYSGRATELLISLVNAVGGSAYLAGGGAGGYQDDTLFEECGVELVKQDFVACAYGDPVRFLPGLSVIDYLMQDGRPLPEAFPKEQ
jgi:hypothetical protein